MARKEPDKLARDAAAALAAGMTYGKWKAMQGPFEIKPETGLPKGWKKCVWCNTPFKPHPNQIYCDWRCQRQAQKAKERQKAKEEREVSGNDGEKISK